MPWDLPDVYRDEDYTWPSDGSSVDSPLMPQEAGDSIDLRGTEERTCDTVGAATRVIPHAGKCAPLLPSRRTRGRES